MKISVVSTLLIIMIFTQNVELIIIRGPQTSSLINHRIKNDQKCLKKLKNAGKIKISDSKIKKILKKERKTKLSFESIPDWIWFATLFIMLVFVILPSIKLMFGSFSKIFSKKNKVKKRILIRKLRNLKEEILANEKKERKLKKEQEKKLIDLKNNKNKGNFDLKKFTKEFSITKFIFAKELDEIRSEITKENQTEKQLVEKSTKDMIVTPDFKKQKRLIKIAKKLKNGENIWTVLTGEGEMFKKYLSEKDIEITDKVGIKKAMVIVKEYIREKYIDDNGLLDKAGQKTAEVLQKFKIGE